MADNIKVLKKMEDFDSLDGVSMEEIASAEADLDLNFALDYKKYLLEFGLASADGHEFTGLVKSARLNVVDVTIKLKKKFKDAPVDAYVIEELGVDDIVIFQTSDGSIYKAAPKTQFIKVADSFAEYLEK